MAASVMKPSWLYQQDSIWIVAGLLVAMMLAGEVGCRLGRHWYPRADDLRRSHLGSVLGSLLGLLALLLSFTFAMSASRYETRRQLVAGDADALGALRLQSHLLPEEPRKSFKRLLDRYVDLRADASFLRDELAWELTGSISEAEKLQEEMWTLVQDAVQAQPAARGADAMLKGLIDAASIHRERLRASESRVPDAVIWLLLFGSLTAMSAVGLAGGLGNHRGLPARIIVSILLCGTIYVILDLDRPNRGLIRVSQTPMLHLQMVLDRDPETRP